MPVIRGFNLAEADNVDDIILQVKQDIIEHGHKTSPRGMETAELDDYTIRLTKPQNGVCRMASRKVSYSLIACEFLMYRAGWGSRKRDNDLLCAIAPRYRQFTNENTGLCDGAYGPRIVRSFDQVIDLLRHDRDSRRAVVPIIEPDDIARAILSKDTPCTNLIQFRIRFNRLFMYVYMRSNDLLWGTPHDMAAFSWLHLYAAGLLGIEPGYYQHQTNSMHYYMEREEKLSGYTDGDKVDLKPLAWDKWSVDTPKSVFEEILSAAAECYLDYEKSSLHFAAVRDQMDFELKQQFGANDLAYNLWMAITGRLRVTPN